MAAPDLGIRRGIALYVILPLIAVLVIISLLPLIETNIWWIRYLDFPRLQLAILLVLLLALFLALRPGGGRLGWAGLLLAVIGLGYHAYKLYPYSGVFQKMAIEPDTCQNTPVLRVMVANVQRRNENAEEFLNLVSEADPDLLLVLETDAWWDEHLAPLRDQFAEKLQYIPEEHAFYGMHLFSKLELVAPEFRLLFDADTPTIFTQLRLPEGEMAQFVGLHPRPPQAWSQPTTMRDAHLLASALEARASDEPTILAGDFNAVPWERVNRRAMRIGGLLDPRVGRGIYPTYDANSLFMSWPLDQVLFEDAFALGAFERLPSFGSDHYPIVVDLCHAPEASVLQAAPEMEASDLQEAETSIEAARAMSENSGAN